jgi:hypothetical protein
MRSGTFQPPKEHLGDVKTQYGNTNLAEHIGFTEAYQAIYRSGSSLVAELSPVYPKSYSWRSASFFTGIDTNLADYLTPVREVMQVVLTALDLVSNVLNVLDSVLSLGINVLKAIVDKVTALLLEILSFLNPAVSVHILAIPPRLGKVDSAIPVLRDSDSAHVKSAKRSELARRDFIRYTNQLGSALPSALGYDVSRLADRTGNNVTGYRYLLETIEAKLGDKTDYCRPPLAQDSSWAGVGLFVGSSAVNQVLRAWESITTLFSRELGLDRLALRGVPAKPVVTSNAIPILNLLETKRLVTSDSDNSSSDAVTVRPIGPRYYTILSGVTYTFELRLICTLAKKSLTDNGSKVLAAIGGALSSQQDIEDAVEHRRVSVDGLLPYSFLTVSQDNSYLSGRVEGFPAKLDDGQHFLVAVDFYRVGEKGYEDTSLLYLCSDITEFTCRSDEIYRDSLGLISLSMTANRNIMQPATYNPRWVAAFGSVTFLPDVFREVQAFIVTLSATIKSFLDDALAWLSVLLKNLQVIIEGYKLILQRIDAILALMQQLLNITASIGASVVRFDGQGDSKQLYSVFKEYLDPSVSSSDASGGSPASLTSKTTLVTTEKERLRSWAEASKASAVANLIVREDSSPYDATGTVRLVSDTRKLVQDSERSLILEDASYAQQPSLSAAWNSTYNMSPMFTEEMTTAGVILLAQDDISGGIVAWKTLMDILFSEDEPASEGDQLSELRSRGLDVDIPPADDGPSVVLDTAPAALFAADMSLTTDPAQSPFDYCPSDE